MNRVSKVEAVSIRPEVTILSVLRHLNYKPWYALAEFVDNSLQSYLTHKGEIRRVDGAKARLVVQIEMSLRGEGQIVVRDNAAGIYDHEFPRAFRPAELPSDRTGLSEFGMGMKSAACWFARHWSVRTKALGEQVEKTVVFDIRHIVKGKLEQVEVKSRSAPSKHHYTEITLWGLHHSPKGRAAGKIREHLASIYRCFLRDGTLDLSIDGEQLVYDDPPILKAPHYLKPREKPRVWRKGIDFKLGKARVYGFAALRETASTSHAGFALFRRNRLIQGSADDTYRPIQIFGNPNSYRYQRLFGELTLDGFDVSHTKDGFRLEAQEEAFLEALRQQLKRKPLDLLDQAEGHRAKPPKKSLRHKAEVATEHVADVVEAVVGPLLKKEAKDPAKPGKLPQTLRRSSMQAAERAVTVYDGNKHWEVTIRSSMNPAVGEWLRLGKQSRKREKGRELRCLTIDVALAHPFVERFMGPSGENVELFVRFAVGFAIALVLTQDSNKSDPSFALHHLNTLLREALSKEVPA